MRKIITSLGHKVVGEAETGAKAYVEYIRLRPDVVTMDLTMEGMSGAEATSKIVATFTDAKIIVISAMEERGVIGPADGARPREVLIRSLDDVFREDGDESVTHIEVSVDPRDEYLTN